MKILLINNRHYLKGGAERVYFNTAQLLRNHGHEVIFFSSTEGKPEKCAQISYFIRAYNKQPKWKALKNYFYNSEAKIRLEELIKLERPDIVHIHLFWGGISPSIFGILKKYKIPIVHTAHDYRMICPAYTFYNIKGGICEQCKGKYFYKCFFYRCSKGNVAQSLWMAMEMYFRNTFFSPLDNLDGIIYVSQFSKMKHLQYNQKFANIPSLVLYNSTQCIDTVYMKKSEHRFFLYLGRLSQEKGVKTLIEAFADLSNMELIIAGTGPEEDKLKQYVEELKMRNVNFIGYKNSTDLKSLIQDAFFVIVPSEWYENNPMSIVESYTLGTPVIGANIGGIPEIIVNYETGFFFASGDCINLKEILKKAYNLTLEEFKIMSLNSLEFAKNNFNEELYYDKLLNFYTEIINHDE